MIIDNYNNAQIFYVLLWSAIYRFDQDLDGFLTLEDMKRMMENLGAPQTHLSLKKMIQEVDADGDSKISFNEVSEQLSAVCFIVIL